MKLTDDEIHNINHTLKLSRHLTLEVWAHGVVMYLVDQAASALMDARRREEWVMSVFSHLPDVGHGRCHCGAPCAGYYTGSLFGPVCYTSGRPEMLCGVTTRVEHRGRSGRFDGAARRHVAAARAAYHRDLK